MKEAKDKAEELIEKFASSTDIFKVNKRSIQCALICVDEIIEELKECETYKDVNQNLPIEWWGLVKKEILNRQ